MSILFNIIDFEEQYEIFRKSLLDSGYDLPVNILQQSICVFLGYKNIEDLKTSLSVIKENSITENIIGNIKNTFTTSFRSHQRKKDVVVAEFNGKIVLQKEVIKKYTYQQFKSGVKNTSHFLKNNNYNVSQLSLLKALSAFLGYKNWNILSAVIKNEKIGIYNVYSKDNDAIIEGAFLALEEGVSNIYFVDLDHAKIVSNYLKQVNTLKHKYNVPLKEIMKVKFINKKDLNSDLFNGDAICLISNNIDTNKYIFNNFIKGNKNYKLIY